MKKEIENLKDLLKVQCSNGNWNYSYYMRGLANGLILALATLENKKPKYLDEPKEYINQRNLKKYFPVSAIKKKGNDNK